MRTAIIIIAFTYMLVTISFSNKIEKLRESAVIQNEALQTALNIIKKHEIEIDSLKSVSNDRRKQ